MEPGRGRLGVRRLHCDCGENRRIKGVWWCLDVFRREIWERRERICPETSQILFYFIFIFIFLQNEGSGCIYRPFLTFQLPTALPPLAAKQGPLATPVNINSSSFFLVQLWMYIWRSYGTWIGMNFESLERSKCLVSIILKKSQI